MRDFLIVRTAALARRVVTVTGIQSNRVILGPLFHLFGHMVLATAFLALFARTALAALFLGLFLGARRLGRVVTRRRLLLFGSKGITAPKDNRRHQQQNDQVFHQFHRSRTSYQNGRPKWDWNGI